MLTHLHPDSSDLQMQALGQTLESKDLLLVLHSLSLGELQHMGLRHKLSPLAVQLKQSSLLHMMPPKQPNA